MVEEISGIEARERNEKRGEMRDAKKSYVEKRGADRRWERTAQ